MEMKRNLLRNLFMICCMVMLCMNANAQKGYDVPELKPEYKALAESILELANKAVKMDTIKTSPKQSKKKEKKSVAKKSNEKNPYEISEATVLGVRLRKVIDEAIMSQAQDSLAKLMRSIEKEGDIRSTLACGDFFFKNDNFPCTTIFYNKLTGFSKEKDSLYVPVMLFLGDYNLMQARNIIDVYGLNKTNRNWKDYQRILEKDEKYKGDTISIPFLVNVFRKKASDALNLEEQAFSFYRRALDFDSMYVEALGKAVEAGRKTQANAEISIPYAERLRSLQPNNYKNKLYLAEMYRAVKIKKDEKQLVANAYVDYFNTVPKDTTLISYGAVENYMNVLLSMGEEQNDKIIEFAHSMEQLYPNKILIPRSALLVAYRDYLSKYKTYAKLHKDYVNDSIGLAKEGMLQYLEKTPNYLRSIDEISKAKAEALFALKYIDEMRFPYEDYNRYDFDIAQRLAKKMENYSAAVTYLNGALGCITIDPDVQNSERVAKQDSVFLIESMAECYRLNKSVDEAVKCYKWIIDIDSVQTQVMYAQIATTYRESERNKDAIGVWEEFVNKYPEEKKTYVDIADLYLSLKNYDKAIETYDKYMKSADSLTVDNYIKFASLYRRAYNDTTMTNREMYKAKTEELYNKAVSMDPTNYRMYAQIGELFNENGKLTEKSVYYYDLALQYCPADSPDNAMQFSYGLTDYYMSKSFEVHNNKTLKKSETTKLLKEPHRQWKKYLDRMKELLPVIKRQKEDFKNVHEGWLDSWGQFKRAYKL